MQQTRRLLLPFTHGVHAGAIEDAVRLAHGSQATLVPLALIAEPGKIKGKGVRLEAIQQAKDFLEIVQCKAQKYQVPIERFEVYTTDVPGSVCLLHAELGCDGMLLFADEDKGVLLQTHEMRKLLEQAACKVYLAHLPARRHVLSNQGLIERLRRWRRAGVSDGHPELVAGMEHELPEASVLPVAH